MATSALPVFPGNAMGATSEACCESGPQRLLASSQEAAAHPQAGTKQLSPIKTAAAGARNVSDAGGATSGHSDTTYHTACLPASATAAAAETEHSALLAVQAPREPASPDSVVTAPKPPQAAAGSPASAAPQLPDLVPLPPPDASEGPEAAAEYELYLQRWDAGDTLVQRWHRLAQKGLLGDIQADWEDWQLDMMLTQVRQRAQAAQAQQRSGAVTPSTGAGSRARRGRAEVEADANDSQADEPRRVRSRRAPSTLQDYHVENAPGRTPDRQDADAAAAAAGAQQGGADVSDNSTDEAPVNPSLLQQHQQGPRGSSLRGQPMHQQHLQQLPPRRPGSRLQRPSSAQPQHQLQQQQSYPAGGQAHSRMGAPYHSPQQMYQQQQMHAQAHMQHARSPQHYQQAQQQQQPQQMMAMMQQLMTQLQPNAAGGSPQQHAQQQQVPPEMTELWFKIGSALGSMMQEQGGPANLLTNPQAMCAMVEAVLRQTTGDPDAAMQQLAATMAKGVM